MENIEELKILVEKYLNHKATAAERLRICEWLEHDEDIDRWFRFQYEAVSPDFSADVKNRIYDNICSNTKVEDDEQQKITFARRFYTATAVACMLFVALVLVGIHYYSTPDYATTPLTVYTNVGDKSRVTLPDGTEVNLNAMSKIAFYYDTDNDTRVVSLSGEAYFNVAQDKNHPFFVQTGDLKVECLGTKFNVNAYPENSYISVVLAEGKVNLVSDRESMLMSPNSLVKYDKTKCLMMKQNVDAINYCEWMNGYIYFNNERFEDIIKVISRNYGITVNILSQGLKEERFTGSVYQADIKKMLNMLTSASGAKCEIISDTLINLSY